MPGPHSPFRGAPTNPKLLLLALLALSLGVVSALWPSPALAIGRPSWNPGPPWAPLAPLSGEMRQISDLFWVMLILSAIIFIGVTGMIIIMIVRFTERDPDAPPPRQIYGSRHLEVAWTAIPFVILVVAFGFTVRAIHAINTPPRGSNPLNIEATGHQWWWEFRYPSLGVITADEIHVPAHTPLHFHVKSEDVIHSFWAPQLQRQIDANPGQDNAVFVVMEKPGIYGGACYEFCGEAHAWMKFRMVVQPRAQFDAWVRHQNKLAAKPSGLAAYGQKVFLHNTCLDCHAINGTKAGGTVAPNLTHLASRWTIGAGAAPMTQADLQQWIRNPSHYKPGALMPPYPLMSQKDLHALAVYLFSLK